MSPVHRLPPSPFSKARAASHLRMLKDLKADLQGLQGARVISDDDFGLAVNAVIGAKLLGPHDPAGMNDEAYDPERGSGAKITQLGVLIRLVDEAIAKREAERAPGDETPGR